MADEACERERFVWPPNPVWAEPARIRTRPRADERRDARTPRAPRTPTPDKPGIVNAIERTWLDVNIRPLGGRLDEAALQPDECTTYCIVCGTAPGPYALTDGRCPECRRRRPRWERMVRVGRYEGLLSEGIRELKFLRLRESGRILGRQLGRAVADALHAEGRDDERPIIVPVPMTRRRRFLRGIDHALVLAREVARANDGRVVRALSRAHRASQLSLPRSERWRNVAGSMRVRRSLDPWGPARPERLGRRLVVLVDDVSTTGATASEGCRALRKGGAREVWVAVVARAISSESDPPSEGVPGGGGMAPESALARV